MAGYIGSTPVPQGVREQQSFTATAGQTTFNTLGYTDGNSIRVTLNGVLLEGGGVDYTASNGSDIVLTAAASVDDVLTFETLNEVQLVSSTSTTPTFKTSATLLNETHEDTDGGRESTLIFQGEQSGGELSTLAEIEASHDGTADDEKGDLIFRTNDGNDGTSPTERLRINSAGDMLFSSDDPSLTIANTTHEDTDGGRESTIVFQGEQSGGEVSTLAQIEAAHDGTGDDEKGELIVRVNDGNDGASPSEVMRINSSGNVGIGTATPAQPLHVFKSGSSGGGLVPLIKVQNDTNNTSGDGSGIEFHGKYQGGEWGFGKIGGTNSGGNFGGALEFHTNTGTGSVSTSFTKKMTIDRNGYVTMPQTPMFSYLGSRTHTVGTGDLVWSTANVWSSAVNHSMNNGSHFNPANGRFTAPITGLYHFQIQAQVYGHSSGYFYTYLDYNQNVRSYIQISQGNNYWLSTHHIYINLNANDFVNASSTNNYSGSQILYPGFSGALVG